MKKLLIASIALLAIALCVFAAAPVAPTLNANCEWQVDSVISAGVLDTVAGTGDSATIATKYRFKPGWEYILTRAAITGTGSDSVKLQVLMRLYDLDTSTAVTYTVYPDSATASTAEAIAIPIGETAFGTRATLKYQAYTDNGGQVILNRHVMWKRRMVLTTVPKY